MAFDDTYKNAQQAKPRSKSDIRTILAWAQWLCVERQF